MSRRPAPNLARAKALARGPIVIRACVSGLCLAGLGMVGLGMVGLVGCAKPLLAPDKPRSQYDRFDAARSERAEQYVFDEYGRRQPNLRERLLPKE